MTTLATFDSRVSFGGFVMNGDYKSGRLEFVGPVADYFWIGIMAMVHPLILSVALLGYLIVTTGNVSSDLTASVSFAWRVAGVVAVALWWGMVWSNVRCRKKGIK